MQIPGPVPIDPWRHQVTEEKQQQVKREIRKQLGNDPTKTLKDVVRPKGRGNKKGWPKVWEETDSDVEDEEDAWDENRGVPGTGG